MTVALLIVCLPCLPFYGPTKSCGIILTDSHGVVTKFYERLMTPLAIVPMELYMLSILLLSELSTISPLPNDFSTEVIPAFLGKIYSWRTDRPYLDIGTPASLAQAQDLLSPML